MVSVILPVRDGSRVVARQLTALLAQTFLGPWELVVVDNGSLDDTYALALIHRSVGIGRVWVSAEKVS